jgi:hypothetical protein
MTLSSRHRTALVLAAIAALSITLIASAGAAKPKATALVGTFKLAPGKFAGATASGSYFTMLQPDGETKFANPDSTAADKTYTLLKPGTQGGFITGRSQATSTPQFDAAGNSTAGLITAPTPFVAIKFGIATPTKDPVSGAKLPLPAISSTGTKLSGQLLAWTAEWNKLSFNQGAKVTGTYKPKTGAFVLTWTKKVSGGPFNGFSGLWHLEGTFVAKKKN